MPRSVLSIAQDIATFVPDGGNWLPLDALIEELWNSGAPGRAIPELLSIFERYPEEAVDVAWSVVHCLEALPAYEPELLKSLSRQPSELGIIMVGRLMNSGTTEVGGVSLLKTLSEVATTTVSENIRRTAQLFTARKVF